MLVFCLDVWIGLINLLQNRESWLSSVNTVMNFPGSTESEELSD